MAIYLDNHSTTRLDPRALDAMMPWLTDRYGNAGSTTHEMGREAREAVEHARGQVARAIGAVPEEIIFTCGATEAINLAILGAAARPGRERGHAVSLATEHRAVLDPLAHLARTGRSVTLLEVAPQSAAANCGRVAADAISRAIRPETFLVSVLLANNEIGTIQPIEAVASICERHGALLHVDACQAFGKVEMDLDLLPAHFVSISGHKIGAPPGVGALYVSDRRLLPPLQVGGEQERSRRAGTENLPGIVGFGAAAAERRAVLRSLIERWTHLRAGFEQSLPAGARVNASLAPRIANTSSVVFPGIDGAALIARLDARGICVSQGSACHSARPEPSHVLRAIGLSESDAYATLRFTLGADSTVGDLDRVLEAIGLEVGAKSSRGGAAVA